MIMADELPKRNIKHLAFLEAILFSTNESLTVEEIQKIMKLEKETIMMLLEYLRRRYGSQESGLRLSDLGGYKLTVKQEFAEKVSHLTPHADLSKGLLRVLSLIAYHEPIKQSDIVKVIGNRAYDYVKDLEGRGFVRSERKAKTKLLTTTPQFETYFAMRKEELKKLVENSKDTGQEVVKKKEEIGSDANQ
jgi:segregation and condensation protein B